ncbi:MAG: hypothetical protein AAF623_07965, partial [Planctomycetota bacterium]
MIEWFTDDPIVPMILGAILVIVFFGFWVMSRDGLMLKACIGIFLITLSIVICESWIVTDKEQIEDTVYKLASHVQNNDINSVLSYISETVPEKAKRARAEMERLEFLSCSILQTAGFKKESKDKAEISFSATARARLKPYPDRHFTRQKVTLIFAREKDEWKMIHYRVVNPMS